MSLHIGLESMQLSNDCKLHSVAKIKYKGMAADVPVTTVITPDFDGNIFGSSYCYLLTLCDQYIPAIIKRANMYIKSVIDANKERYKSPSFSNLSNGVDSSKEFKITNIYINSSLMVEDADGYEPGMGQDLSKGIVCNASVGFVCQHDKNRGFEAFFRGTNLVTVHLRMA